MSQPKHCVYILRTVADPPRYYVGLTADLDRRLTDHNAGASPHTAQHRPWRSLVSIEFDAEAPAAQFERYLKTGSGREFARRHFRMTL
jgi:putative endonuclease